MSPARPVDGAILTSHGETIAGLSGLLKNDAPRVVDKWVSMIELEPKAYGPHSLRRTKVALLDKKTGHLRACQLLLGHRKLKSTVRYLGTEVDDALEMSEQIDL